MRKRILTVLFVGAFAISTLSGCGKSEPATTTSESETVTENAESETEAPHEHNYTEEVTKEATCIEEGEKTFTCECGDTYTEEIPVTGHDFAEYVSNEDATYEADGTETAICSVCGETDTRVAEGSMLTYTFENMEATKYAKSTVNVRSLPTADGEKLGGLSTNDEVKVTGKCNETGWYRIEYSDGVAYVSDSYLVDNKVETKSAETTSNSSSTASASSSTECPYPLYTVYEDDTTYWFYCVWDKVNHPGKFGDYWTCAKSIEGPWNVAHGYNEQASGMMRSDPLDTPYMSDGLYVLKVVYQK